MAGRSTTRRLVVAVVFLATLLPVELPLPEPFGVSTGSIAEARRRRRTPRARRRLGRRLFRSGQQLMAQGRYKRAVHAFNRSFALLPVPQTLLALAQCHELAGHLNQARRLYKRLLKKPGGLDRKVLKERLEAVEKRIAGKEPAEPTKPTSQPTEPPDEGGDVTMNIGPDEGGDVTMNIGPDEGGGDVTMDIGGGGGGEDEGAGDISPLEVSGLLSGWIRSSLDVDLGNETADGPTDVLEDSLEFRNRLLMRLDVRYGARYHGFVSALMDHVLREQPPNPGDTFLLFNGRGVRSDFEASVIEAYVSVALGRFDLRGGMLRVPWGKSDYISPNDVVNPRDLRNPFREELEILRLPVLAVEGSVDISPLSISVVWQPVFRPDRMALYGSDYGVVNPHLPAPIRGLANFIQGLHDEDLTSQVEQVLIQTDLPAADGRSSSVGARMSLQLHGVDVSLYYHYGWDLSPRLEMSPQVLQALATVDWSTAQLQTLGPLLQLADAGVPLYTADFVRRHHVGGDVAATLGSFSLRAEVGVDMPRVFYDPSFVSYTEPALAVGCGAEYQKSLYQMALLELSYMYVGGGPDKLLFYDRNSLGFGGMVRWGVLRGDLVGELRGFIGAMPWTYIVRPQVTYKFTRRWSLAAGAVILGGDSRGIGGFYDRNDVVFLEGTYNL